MTTKAKKVTAKELDEQIGYGKELDTKAILSKVKKTSKNVGRPVSEIKKVRKPLPPADKVRELTQKRTKKVEKSKEPAKQINKVRVEMTPDGKLIVWASSKVEGYLKAVWKSYTFDNIDDALNLAKQFITQMDIKKVA